MKHRQISQSTVNDVGINIDFYRGFFFSVQNKNFLKLSVPKTDFCGNSFLFPNTKLFYNSPALPSPPIHSANNVNVILKLILLETWWRNYFIFYTLKTCIPF